jgi:hypothetical protein
MPLLTDDRTTLSARSAALWLPHVVLLSLVLLEALVILILNDGHLIFTLDDPYIHLSLAENIWRGHYGVNAGESCAPSSSIVWPFLISPIAGWRMAPWILLALNTLISAATLYLFNRSLLLTLKDLQTETRYLAMAVLSTLLILATNLVGPIFTGMEHPLQIFIATAVIWGLIYELEHRQAPWWIFAAIVLGPLVRYENLAISLPMLVYLFVRGYVKASLLSGFSIIATNGFFAFFLTSLGLHPIPIPVLLKITGASSGGGVISVLRRVYNNLGDARGMIFAAGMAILIVVATSGSRRKADRYFAGTVALSVMLFLVFGRLSWFRYQNFVWTALLLALIYLFRRRLVQSIERRSVLRVGVAAALFTITLCHRCLLILVTIPLGANNIYEQQYQMHRFATEFYRAPVAVNDLGWVSYDNDNYVLDLWGVGSEAALAGRRGRAGDDWMNTLTATHGVQMAMIYDSWFKAVPENWIPAGRLYLGKMRLMPADDPVSFYALNPEAASRVSVLLRSFRETLPPGVSLEFPREQPEQLRKPR